jgi:hypothetical protein
MSKNLISYSGTVLKQFDLVRAKAVAVKMAKRKAKGKKVDEDKVFEPLALEKTSCLTFRQNTTKEVSDDELKVIKEQVGKVFFERFFIVHDAPKVPRSLRVGEPGKPESGKPKKPIKTLNPKPDTKSSGKGAV